jgi:hypothetical protein
MKSLSRPFQLLAALAALAASATALSAAVGEVSLSGSTWTGKVDGVTKYTGTNMSAAANACVAAMGDGTVRIYNGGGSGGTINLKTNVKADAWGNAISGVSGAANGIIRARNSSNTGVKNINCGGSQWFGMYFQTSAGQTFSGISGGAGILMRIDNCAGGGGSNFSAGSPNATASGGHGVETYGINGTTFGTITATDRSGGCGIMFNPSQNGTGSTVNGTRCNYSGGYAALRAGTSSGITISRVNATSCGRGIFTLVNANNIAVGNLAADGCRDIGVWLESSTNTRVQAGYVRNGPCFAITGTSTGSYVSVSCQ